MGSFVAMTESHARLYVGNLSPATSREDLERMLATGGRRVVDVQLVCDEESGRPRGFAFVELASESEALTAIEDLDGELLDGRPLKLETAPLRPKRTRFHGERWES